MRPNYTNIGAVMSTPRLGFMDTFDCASTACGELGINLSICTGVFWGQKLEIGMETAIKAGKDWILTIDYDSIFLSEHLLEMFKLIEKYPDIDALAPVQVKRFSDKDNNFKVLCSVEGKELFYEDLDLTKDTTDVNTAHFGLTLIKTAALLEMPKPWFWSKPNEDGFWEKGGKMDDDIYFWHKFKDTGHKACVANNVMIGHLETLTLCPGKDGKLRYLNSYEFRDEARESFKQRRS